MAKLSFLLIATVWLLASTTTASSARNLRTRGCDSSVYPNVADTSHATPGLVTFLRNYFTAKSLHDADAWLPSFGISKAIYIDATLGWYFDPTTFEAALRNLMKSWTSPAAISYPLRIIGDMNSAVVFFKSTPAAFGSEISGVGVIDFENNKVIRQVDYWDGRRVPLLDQRVPDGQYPADFGESGFHGRRSPVIQNIAEKLHASLSLMNSTAVAGLFSVDAVFEDRAIRTKIEGQLAIERYLNRTLHIVPYGSGATLRHVVGSVQGGGYEWIGGPGAIARNGLIAAELDNHHLITRLTVV